MPISEIQFPVKREHDMWFHLLECKTWKWKMLLTTKRQVFGDFYINTYFMLSIVYYWLQNAILSLVFTSNDWGSHMYMTMDYHTQVGLYQTPSPIPPIPPLI
jgi:hypothetical protein